MIHTKIDLNLFVVLRTVYQQGSITGAARQLHITQPAVSHALAKLREKFDDPLFIRHGRNIVPSALCQTIMPQIEHSILALESTLSPHTQFDIQQHERQMKLGMRDILESWFLPPLVQDLSVNTPRITIQSQQIRRNQAERLLEDESLDIIIDVLMPLGEKMCSQFIRNEHFSLVCRQGHPILDNTTLAQYVKYPHGIVFLKGSEVDIIDMALAKHGVTRNVILRCEHYNAAASVAAQSDMLLTMPNAYVEAITESHAVEVTQVPFDVPDMPIHMFWHKKSNADPINQWMRNKLLAIANGRL